MSPTHEPRTRTRNPCATANEGAITGRGRISNALRRFLCGSAGAPDLSHRLCVIELEPRFVPSSSPLHVVGNQIEDASGNTVVLRGVNLGSLEYRPDGFPSTDPNIPHLDVMDAERIAIRSWGANLIRLPVNQDFWFGHYESFQTMPNELGDATHSPGYSYRYMIDQIIQYANQHGAYVMIDLHRTDMNMLGTGSDDAQHIMPDMNSITFWQQVAAKYANNPTVLFDLFNEPRDQEDDDKLTGLTASDWNVWRNGGTIHETKYIPHPQTYYGVGMQTLLDTVRGTGAGNIVSAEGLDYAGVLPNVGPGGYGLTDSAANLMYQVHLYPDKLTHGNEAKIAVVAEQYPIYVGEWGADNSGVATADWGLDPNATLDPPNAQALADNTNMLAYLDDNGYDWTAYGVSPEPEYNLIDWKTGAASPDFGVPVMNDLQSFAHISVPPVTSSPPAHTPVPLYAAGSGVGGNGFVTVYTPSGGGILEQFQPFGNYSGGVKVAVGDVNGDGYSDLVVLAGPGALNGIVGIFSGKDFSLITAYNAFPGYGGEFNVAVGDINGDGLADVIFSTATNADYVFAYSGASQNLMTLFSAFAAFGGFTGGVTIATGDVNRDGIAEIIVGTATRFGAASEFNIAGQMVGPLYVAPSNGVNVAAGDINGDGYADVIFGARDSTIVTVFDSRSQSEMMSFLAYPGHQFGVTVATVDRDGDGRADIITGFDGPVSAFGIYSGISFELFDVGFSPAGAHGLFVGGSGS